MFILTYAFMIVMQRKIYRLVVTDFCCWVPISIMAFVHFSGTPVSDIAYVISAIVLLPINSALNPILYSNAFDQFLKRFRRHKNIFLSSENTKKSTETQKSPTVDTNL